MRAAGLPAALVETTGGAENQQPSPDRCSALTVRDRRTAALEPAAGQREELQSFIICKTDGVDPYFRSNPPWIAIHAVEKMRQLLLRLRDESICIDYWLRREQACSYPWWRREGPRPDSLAPQDGRARVTQQMLYQEGERLVAGEGRQIVRKHQRAQRRECAVQFQVARCQSAVADRCLIERTLDSFPFPGLKGHSKGSVNFQEALNYFVYELKCEPARLWVEHDAEGRPTHYAELLRPGGCAELQSPLPRWLDPDWQRQARQTPKKNRLVEFWLGDQVPWFDAVMCTTRAGGPWEGWRGFGSGRRMSIPYAPKAVWRSKAKVMSQ